MDAYERVIYHGTLNNAKSFFSTQLQTIAHELEISKNTIILDDFKSGIDDRYNIKDINQLKQNKLLNDSEYADLL